MRVLMLDIDGCCNHIRTPVPEDGMPLEPYAVLLIHRICEATGAKIVVSSSWRNWRDGLDRLIHDFSPFVIGVTPNSRGLTSRGTEIKAWLEDNPDVDRYAIIDDNDDMLEEQWENFFQINPVTGITDDDAKKIIEHLNAPV